MILQVIGGKICCTFRTIVEIESWNISGVQISSLLFFMKNGMNFNFAGMNDSGAGICSLSKI